MSIIKPTNGIMPRGVIEERLSPETVLHEGIVPMLYTARTLQGQGLLAYVTDINEDGVFTILVPLTQQTLHRLQRGFLTVLQALSQAPAMLHWSDAQTSETWAFDISALPPIHLPAPHLTLRRELNPVLTTRAIGEEIVLGRIPASVVAFVADSTRKAFKTVLDCVVGGTFPGRPSDEHRGLYDLPIQSFQFASFELSFAAPENSMFPEQDLRRAAEKLEAGLQWASSDGNRPYEANTDEEREAVLRATLLLTPPSGGPISEVRISGSWLTEKEILLNRASRRKVREALRQVDSEEVVFYEGLLEELDTGKLTFTLRDVPERSEIKGAFTEDILEDMLNLLTHQVSIAGVERRGKFIASIVSERTTPSASPQTADADLR